MHSVDSIASSEQEVNRQGADATAEHAGSAVASCIVVVVERVVEACAAAVGTAFAFVAAFAASDEEFVAARSSDSIVCIAAVDAIVAVVAVAVVFVEVFEEIGEVDSERFVGLNTAENLRLSFAAHAEDIAVAVAAAAVVAATAA